MGWYVLQVMTGTERDVCTALRRKGVQARAPAQRMEIRRWGQWQTEERLLLFRTQRGNGQTGQPLSRIAQMHFLHRSGGFFSFAPESFRASSRRGSFRFTAHHRPQG